MEEINSNEYSEQIKKYTPEQLIYEGAILDIEESNLYAKKKAYKAELKRRLRGE